MTTELQSGYYVSPEEYLAGELQSDRKHEYLAGVIYARAGASIGHDRIAGNILSELRGQIGEGDCDVFSSDVKVSISRGPAKFFYYPDVTVDCSGANDRELFANEPRVIFEVLSPDTERIDRGEKLGNYQSLASLDAYVLVDQFRVAVTVYRRAGADWAVELYTSKEDLIEFPTIGCRLGVAGVYRRTQA